MSKSIIRLKLLRYYISQCVSSVSWSIKRQCVLIFSDPLKNQKLHVKMYRIPFSGFNGEVEMSQPIGGHGGHLGFFDWPENTNLVEDPVILLPVKFR